MKETQNAKCLLFLRHRVCLGIPDTTV